jgi:hypothetical protein
MASNNGSSSASGLKFSLNGGSLPTSIDRQADNLQLHSTFGREFYRQHLAAIFQVVTHCIFFGVNKISTLEYLSGRLFTSVQTFIGEKDKSHMPILESEFYITTNGKSTFLAYFPYFEARSSGKS